uniref:Uncharacterized protein n=1 Tax=uncultured marine virus TaxID=186617 RepID=A0A0F7L7K7_9VIRU|nr:hypothetical protein [uncultured marine virus]
MKKEFLLVGLGILVIAGLFIALPTPDAQQDDMGSVQQGSEYHSVITGGGITDPDGLLKTGGGALGSVVITGANTGLLDFYNATTTDVGARAASKTTSSLWVASIPASLAAGTYTFDAIFYDGLYVQVSGTLPTSTITYR